MTSRADILVVGGSGAISGAYACGCIGTNEEFITPELLRQYRRPA